MAEAKHTPTERHSFHRAMAHLSHGALHRHFGLSESEPIPDEKIEEGKNSYNPHVRRMSILADNMKSWKHGKK